MLVSFIKDARTEWVNQISQFNQIYSKVFRSGIQHNLQPSCQFCYLWGVLQPLMFSTKKEQGKMSSHVTGNIIQ